jgi:hypothetical protein
MRTLTEIFNSNMSDKGTVMEGWEAHGYSPFYERWFEQLRDQPVRVLEIGVCDPRQPGASLVSWYEYFPRAKILGYDIVDSTRFDNDRIATFMGDQSDSADVARFLSLHGGDFDIVIDDGSHMDAHQQASLGFLLDQVKPGGQYIIEDMQVSPNTLQLMKDLQSGYYGHGATLARWAWRRVQRRAPLLSRRALAAIQAQVASVDLLCDNKLARIVKR